CDSPDPVDYPDVALTVAKAVARGDHDRAILVCGTGIGMAIAANKVPGVYATVAHDPYSAAKARTSNNTQVLPLGGRAAGHEPAFAGYVGRGIADAAACGNIFASPPPNVVLAAIHAAHHGRGVLMAYGNYAGDVMNFGLAAQLAGAEGIDVREIHVSDDVA